MLKTEIFNINFKKHLNIQYKFIKIIINISVPPLLGFCSKTYVLYSAIQSGYNFISILGIIVSVISASYYLKIVKVLMDDTKINYLPSSTETLKFQTQNSLLPYG